MMGRGAGRTRSACFLFAVTGLALLLAPVMTTVYHFRYVLPALPLLGPAGALGLSVLLDRLRARR